MIEHLSGIHETIDYKGDNGIRLYYNDEAEDYPIHWHLETEIIMPVDSVYTVEVDGVQRTLNPYDILVVPSGALHRMFAPPKGLRIILQVDSSKFADFPNFSSVLQILSNNVVLEQNEQNSILSKTLLALVEEYFTSSPLREAACYSYILQFFINLSRVFWDSDFTKHGYDEKKHVYIGRLLEVCNYIDQHCTEKIESDELAAIAGFSKFHFLRLFKQYMEVTYYDYLTTRRIQYAEKLLIDPDCTIMQAAFRSGFNSLTTFNRVFKMHKKCTPSAFIALNRYGETRAAVVNK